MIKIFKNKRFLIWIFFSLIFLSDLVYWQDLTLSLQTDKSSYDINETISLTLSIQASENTTPWTVQINWLENFDTVTQSNATNMQNINGQVSMLNQINLWLNGKTKWTYEIWPAEIQIWTWIQESNIVKIEISWERMFIWNSAPNYTNQPIQTVQNTGDENVQNNLTQVDYNKLRVFLIVIVVGVIVATLIIIKNKKSKSRHELDNKVEKIQKIIFPKIDDKNFFSKISKNFNLILQNITWISVESLTYNEIKNLENFKNLDDELKEKLEKIFDLLILQKYSKGEVDRKEMLELFLYFHLKLWQK